MGKLYHLNVGFGDSSIIISGSSTFLIDCHKIEDNAGLLPLNKRIKAVFITHQHRDHFSGLTYLMQKGYSVDFLIYSPYVRRYNDKSVEYDEWFEFSSYKTYFRNKGTKLYEPYRQVDFSEPWWTISGLKFWLLGPPRNIATKETRELHDASLVIHAKMGTRRCLFAGDSSNESLKYIADNTTNICNDILHASHHGSLEGADLSFIKNCNMDYTVISTKSGVYQNVPHPTALSRYENNTKKRVYRTDIFGTAKWNF
ncbi:MAG: ComEC/Rec2 family competence protein [Planctomycetota bacterium]|jgi:beta-lactamase superfamily II metal-dependent hydrolase